MPDRLNLGRIENLDCTCGSKNLRHAGSRNGKKAYECQDCGKRFTREQRYDMFSGLKGVRYYKDVGPSV